VSVSPQKKGDHVMAKAASDYLVQRLYDWGVRRMFGHPGDGGADGPAGSAGVDRAGGARA
jgi:hypothetical protein